MMLKLYLDDTGTHTGSRLVGVGGLLGTEAQWSQFDREWKMVLKEPYPGARTLKKWSSYDCFHGTGEFEGYSQGARDLVTRAFRDVITNSGVWSASNIIDGQAWNELVGPLKWDTIVGSPEAVCLFALMDRLRAFVRLQSDDRTMAVFYDAGRANEPEVKTLVGLLQAAVSRRPEIASFSFVKVADATPLQGADMIATESFWYARDLLNGATSARPHWEHYLKENFNRGNGAILDRDGILAEIRCRHPDGKLKEMEVWDALLGRPSSSGRLS